MGEKRGMCLGTMLLAGALALASCGDEVGNETVYLHVFNAYAGAESISLYGPSGAVATNLPFGERTDQPVAVDRNMGTDFTLVVDGAPEPADLSMPLYSMYPHETGTILFKRRESAEEVATPELYRHVQSIAENSCRIVFDNALSAQNGNLANYNYAPIWNINPSCAPYIESLGTYSESDPDFGRPNLISQVEQNAWFVPVDTNVGEIIDIKEPASCPAFDGPQSIARETSVKLIWAPHAGINFDTGRIFTQLTTRDYMECIGWDPLASPADNAANIEPEDVFRCREGDVYEVAISELDGQVNVFQVPPGIGNGYDANTCGFPVRIASDFANIFVGDRDNGEIVSDEIRFTPAQHYFWVLYGRPINPRFIKWGTRASSDEGGTFTELPDYPGGQ